MHVIHINNNNFCIVFGNTQGQTQRHTDMISKLDIRFHNKSEIKIVIQFYHQHPIK